jgi:hypothetical protein
MYSPIPLESCSGKATIVIHHGATDVPSIRRKAGGFLSHSKRSVIAPVELASFEYMMERPCVIAFARREVGLVTPRPSGNFELISATSIIGRRNTAIVSPPMEPAGASRQEAGTVARGSDTKAPTWPFSNASPRWSVSTVAIRMKHRTVAYILKVRMQEPSGAQFVRGRPLLCVPALDADGTPAAFWPNDERRLQNVRALGGGEIEVKYRGNAGGGDRFAAGSS